VKLSRARELLGVHAIAVLLVLAGCGGSSEEDAVTDAVAEYVDALRDGDADAACDLLAQPALEDLDVSGGCALVLGKGLALAEREGVTIPDYEITDVQVDGDHGEATLVSAATDDVVPLVREEGEWKLEGATALAQFHPDNPLP
jgi:hypothetical protein